MTDTEATLEEIRPLLRLIAHERAGKQTWLYDDAEQEAMIAAWTRLKEGKSIGIAVHNAKQAVVDLLRGGRATGSKTGAPLGAHARAIPLTLPGSDGGDDYTIEPADPNAQAAYDDIDSRDALAGLLAPLSDEQRSLVLSRLDGLTTREIASERGVTHQAISLRLKRVRELLAA